MKPAHIPLSTYRLQMHHGFPFQEARRIIPYLKKLGITDVYLSPITTARHGSLHGYDAVNHQEINPELGGRNGFLEFSKELSANGMHAVLDVVPNHMCIADPANRLWMDVLENGPASPYAKFFDVNWAPMKKEIINRVLLPILGDQFGKVLEEGQIRLIYEDNIFLAQYADWKLPIGPKSWATVLSAILLKISIVYDNQNPDRMELESILNGFNYLPSENETAPDRIQERQREKEILKKRWARLVESNPLIQKTLQQELLDINGQKGNPHSFDRLEELVDQQVYRLCDWKVAADEINYRRFFDLNELAAIRVEDQEVFEEVHKAVFEWIREGWIHGLRIDHVDGLLDPQKYLSLLQKDQPLFVVVEKILSGREELNREWPVAGSTGYDFLNWVNGLYVDGSNQEALENFYQRFSLNHIGFEDTAVTSKKLIMLVSMASELRMLSLYLDRISEQHRWSRDFTLESLRFALREVAACFPVYRTYHRDPDHPVEGTNREFVARAIREAKRRNPATPESIFDFIESVLTLNHPEGLTEDQKAARFQFLLKFQQFTGPVMAKGVEDTSFYRIFPLLSVNEVGGHPDHFGMSRRTFHQIMTRRQKDWPYSLSASTTHDTKRGEDTRARINVLSEIPVQWGHAVRKWHQLNLPHKNGGNHDRPAPDKNEEFLLYQTLIGSWPLVEEEKKDYAQRIRDFFLKALRESKVNSSWFRPHVAYEKAALDFVDKILDPKISPAFLKSFEDFHSSIIRAGLFNALSQAVVKVTAPGIPDFYQGTEMWNFSLVDPDNRRPVDYAAAERHLAELEKDAARLSAPDHLKSLLKSMSNGRIKIFMIQQALALRGRHPEVFQDGAYVPLAPNGFRKRNMTAFIRKQGSKAVMVWAGRFFMDFGSDSFDWGDTVVAIPQFVGKKQWRNVFTGRVLSAGQRVEVKEELADLPCALLESV